MGDGSVNLPPGFRFSPTDEELVLHFLHRKASLLPCQPDIIPDLGLHRPFDPWELDGKALSSGGHWYFFSRKMDNQVTANGYWKPLDVEQPISIDDGRKKVGMKKYLVYNIGEPPTGAETDWMMQEYHLCSYRLKGASSYKRNKRLDGSEWVLRRVYQQKGSSRQSNLGYNDGNDYDDGGSELSCLDEMFLSLDDDDLGDLSFSD